MPTIRSGLVSISVPTRSLTPRQPHRQPDCDSHEAGRNSQLQKNRPQVGGFRTGWRWPETRLLTALLSFSGTLVLVCGGASVRAADRCPGAETTLAILQCLDHRLAESDRTLARKLEGVASASAHQPGEPFGPIWRDFNNQYSGGSDPGRQLRAFQRQRRQTCRYANSMSLQGSGFGVFVLSCELDLTEALLQQFRN